VRQGKGDHRNIKMPNGQLITIPVSKELKMGLFKSSNKKGGIDRRRIRAVTIGRRSMREYTVLIHPAEEGGYWADVPALPGCFSQGETIDEALKNIKEAIELHLRALREEDEKTPPEEELIIGRIRVEVAEV
jgi:predicted RNase H-like HicB family nuclease